MKAANEDGSVDMLSPNGTLLVDANLSQDDIDKSSEALVLNTQTQVGTMPDANVTQVDLGDDLQSISEAIDGAPLSTDPATPSNTTVTFNGKIIPKAKALALYSRH